jgi:hypothetical protein
MVVSIPCGYLCVRGKPYCADHYSKSKGSKPFNPGVKHHSPRHKMITTKSALVLSLMYKFNPLKRLYHVNDHKYNNAILWTSLEERRGHIKYSFAMLGGNITVVEGEDISDIADQILCRTASEIDAVMGLAMLLK